ncbi:MAG: hypothetical protein VB036_18625 [Propionicimonas sp.]|nr:hypothetical protein [Propionicimonas sp.]
MDSSDDPLPARDAGRPLIDPVGTGGDPACWLAQVCPQCNALVEGPVGTPCWHCGMPLPEQ